MCTKLVSPKIILIDRCAIIFREPFILEKRTRKQELEKIEFKQ